jgi:hypothetical protein
LSHLAIFCSKALSELEREILNCLRALARVFNPAESGISALQKSQTGGKGGFETAARQRSIAFLQQLLKQGL